MQASSLTNFDLRHLKLFLISHLIRISSEIWRSCFLSSSFSLSGLSLTLSFPSFLTLSSSDFSSLSPLLPFPLPSFLPFIFQTFIKYLLWQVLWQQWWIKQTRLMSFWTFTVGVEIIKNKELSEGLWWAGNCPLSPQDICVKSLVSMNVTLLEGDKRRGSLLMWLGPGSWNEKTALVYLIGPWMDPANSLEIILASRTVRTHCCCFQTASLW